MSRDFGSAGGGGAVGLRPTPSRTVAGRHTVEKTRGEEDCVAATAGVAITESRIEAIGAGREPPASAIREGRWWRYKPSLPVLPSVVLANSTFADGYSLCWSTECRPLAVIAPQGEQVAITASECTRAVPPTKMP